MNTKSLHTRSQPFLLSTHSPQHLWIHRVITKTQRKAPVSGIKSKLHKPRKLHLSI